MNFKVKAIVLKQKPYLENQKYLDILTPKNGILNVKLAVKGQITKNVFSNVNVSGFYEFNLFNGKFGIIVDCVEETNLFFKLRFNPKKFALSQYFCELSHIFNLSLENSKKQLNLLLNTLWLLENKNVSCKFLKAVFELKLICHSGYMPNLVCCKFCCVYEKSQMFFNLFKGFLICKDCLNLNKNLQQDKLVLLTKAVLYAMRFIIYKEDKKIFNFKLSKENLNLFSKIVENIVLLFLEKPPLTLKIYKQFTEEFGCE